MAGIIRNCLIPNFLLTPTRSQNQYRVMKKLSLLAALASCVVAAHAQSYFFTVSLSGASENPANASSGLGFGTITLNLNNPADPNDNTLNYSVSYANLSANSTAAHIHGPATTSQNAGVLVGLTGTLNAKAGTLAASNVAANSTLTSALLNGLAYVNIHSTSLPGGEIRGQANLVAVVPEADSAMLVGGLLGLGAIAWRIRRK